MTFLNPYWLFALPLIALPIVIHLLNQRRHRTVPWGAMQFLLSAKKMSRGMARLRQWLIMAARMLVIAGLIFAISRPLSTGWAGSLTGGKPETVIVLLDRSASMQQRPLQMGETKLASGVSKIVDALQTIGFTQPLTLIENSDNRAITVDRPQALLDLPQVTGTQSQSNLLAMLQTTLDFANNNKTGRTDIWICSDAARNDWNPNSSLWKSLNSGFSKLEGVRFHVVNYSEPPQENFSVVVDRLERVNTKEHSELVIDLTVQRVSQNQGTVSVPLTFNINGLRSVVNLEIEGEAASLLGHRIPVDREAKIGWGQVELPLDSSPADNSWYFAFADPTARQTAVVSENKPATRAVRLAAATSTINGTEYQAYHFSPDNLDELDWQATSLLVWQAPLPTGAAARQITSFVESGRTVLFLPPEQPDDQAFANVQWGQWERSTGDGQAIGFWNNDQDLLSKTRDGQALPVNDLKTYHYCSLKQTDSDTTQLSGLRALAKLENGSPLLARMASNAGAVYFLTTLPVGTHSSLDRDGVTLFAMLQRAIATGAESLGAAKQLDAGSKPAQQVADLPQVAPESDSPGLAQARPFLAGVYGNQEQLIALNRPLNEDRTDSLPKDELDQLFAGLDYHLIDDTLGNEQALASETWRIFVALMGLALLMEAWLCLPPVVTKTESVAGLEPVRRAA